MLATSIIALLVGGALASPCAPERPYTWVPEPYGSGAAHGNWGDHNLPMTSSTTKSPGHSGSTVSSTTKSSGHTSSSASSTTKPPGSTSTPHPDSIIQYSVVPGYFVQADNATSDGSAFDYATKNFGLTNQTYDTDTDASLTQWQRFAVKLEDLQASAPKDTSYKMVFMGRHGEGFHNAMESYVGTPAWNCYWALLEGANSSFIYADAAVTEAGIAQAEKARKYWKSRYAEEKIPFIQSYYSSPMQRCLQTAELTFGDLELPKEYPFKPLIREGLREGMAEHTCNRRSTKSWIKENFPGFSFEAGFTEQDDLWTGTTTEVPQAQDFRSKQMLDDVFSSDKNTWLSFTSHSGEITSILRVVGHRKWSLSTGQVIPVLIKAVTSSPEKAATTVTSATWTPSPFCTQPPVTSIPSWGEGLGKGCVCQSSASPVITQLPPFPTITATPA